jgi:trigger factor
MWNGGEMKNNATSKSIPALIATGIAVVSLLIGLVGGWFGHSIFTDHEEKKKLESASNVTDGSLIDYVASDNLKLAVYNGTVVDLDPTEEELQSAITDMRNKYPVKKDVVLKKGDIVTIDFTAYMDGKKLQDGEAEDYSLTLGAGEFLEEFENNLIGKEVGKTVKIIATFPEDYGDDSLNGKKADFTVKIKSVAAPYTDELVKKDSKGEFKTIAEYEKDLKESLRAEKEDSKADEAWNQVLQNSEVIKAPAQYKEIAIKDIKLQYEAFAKQQGSTLEEVLTNFGMTEDDLPDLAMDSMKERMVAKTIAKKENLSIDDKFLKKFIEDTLGEENSKKSLTELVKTYKEQLSSHPKDDALIEKAKEFVASKCKTAKS